LKLISPNPSSTATTKNSSRSNPHVTIRFEPETTDELKTYASEKGIGVTTLACMWILERLKAEREQ